MISSVSPYHQYVLCYPFFSLSVFTRNSFCWSLSASCFVYVSVHVGCLFVWFFSDLALSFWWQLYSILLCLTNVGMLLLFPVCFVPSEPAVLGLWALMEGTCGCAFCLQWLWVQLLFPDPQNALSLFMLYMSAAALEQPSYDCTVVFPFFLMLICVWKWFPNVLFCCIRFLLNLWFLPAFPFCASFCQAVLWYRKQRLIKCWQLGDNNNINSVAIIFLLGITAYQEFL